MKGKAMIGGTIAEEPAVLTCWKDIARYMGKGVRTVQRWEQEFGLPVKRPNGIEHKSAVLAHPKDLEAWMASRWSLKARKKASNGSTRQRERLALGIVKEEIEKARSLRHQHGQLVQELSDITESLRAYCWEMRKRDPFPMMAGGGLAGIAAEQ